LGARGSLDPPLATPAAPRGDHTPHPRMIDLKSRRETRDIRREVMDLRSEQA
jgi:hypothetical protein